MSIEGLGLDAEDLRNEIEVYKLNNYFRKPVTDPNNIKGPKIPLKNFRASH